MPTTFVSWRCFFLHWLVVKTPPKDAFRALLFFFQYSTAGLQLCNKMHLLILLISFNRMRLYHKDRIFGTIERVFLSEICIYIYIFGPTSGRTFHGPRCLAVPIRCGTKIPIGACGKSGSTDQDGTFGSSSLFVFFNFSNPVYTRNNDIKTKEGRVWPQKWRFGFLDRFSLLMKWFFSRFYGFMFQFCLLAGWSSNIVASEGLGIVLRDLFVSGWSLMFRHPAEVHAVVLSARNCHHYGSNLHFIWLSVLDKGYWTHGSLDAWEKKNAHKMLPSTKSDVDFLEFSCWYVDMIRFVYEYWIDLRR